jgi:hypothetical protein
VVGVVTPRLRVRLAMQLSPAFRVVRVVTAVALPTRLNSHLDAPSGRRCELWWWEFESEIKRTLALEILMRKMFAMAS